MTDAYESKLRAKIAECYAELEKSQQRVQKLTVRREALADALNLYSENRPLRPGPKPSTTGRAGSKFGFILRAIQESGERGLSTSEMYAKASLAGINVKPNTVRSQLYQRKTDGLLEHLPNGRYRLASFQKDEAPDSLGASKITSGVAAPLIESNEGDDTETLVS